MTVIKVCLSCDYVENLPENRVHCIQCEKHSLGYWESIEKFKAFIRLYPEKALDFRMVNSQLVKAYDEVMLELELKVI